MSLIVEDGSIVANANSYVTVDEIRDYANDRGFNLSIADPVIVQNAILAMDYLQSKNYQGCMVEPLSQPLLWPREDVFVNQNIFPSDQIPQQLKNAQIELTIASVDSELLDDGSGNNDNIKSEEISGELKFEYFDSNGDNIFKSQRVNSYLNQLVSPINVVRL
jgi:hypothetical protein